MASHELRPRTSEELTTLLREATLLRQVVVPWGAGTRQHIGYAAPDNAITLHTTALDHIVEHVAADMTVTTEAGIALGTLQTALAKQGQWLPWEPPQAAHATVGGLLASAAHGALRLGYGTPRDWVLGMQVVLGDGRCIKSGGRVVKNVAGYDLHKLHVGALGTLGIITSITFKVFPLPETSRTLLFTCADHLAALRLADALRERPYTPASLVMLNQVAARELLNIDVDSKPNTYILAARWAGITAAVERQAQAANSITARMQATTTPIDETQAQAVWQQIADFTAPAAERFILRAAAAPAHLDALLSALHTHIPTTKQATAILAYPGIGLCQARLTLPPNSNAALASQTLAALRAAFAALNGYAVVEDAPPALRAALDLWGPVQNQSLMQSLRRQWDPADVLNRGRYVV